MARYQAEPPHKHDRQAQVGILLCNLGSPEAPTARALRPYLREFLSDPRVVEMPRLLWQAILRGIILNTRPAKSAEKYAKVWTPDGPPLLAHTRKQASLLAGYLGHAGHRGLVVDWAMRYGSPAIPARLNALREQGCTRILVIPLYPQYAASTTASIMDAVARCLLAWRNLPEIRYVRSFHDQPGYVAALEAQIRQHWMKNDPGEILVMSFHGTSRHSLDQGDPYFCECQKTARLLAEALKLPPERYRVSFQSRFGRTEWLQPYTHDTLLELGKAGKRIDLICPGFVSDCLETLEEIAIEGKATFLQAGGKEFQYIPCLNENHAWIDALAKLCVEQLGPWLQTTSRSDAERETTLTRAKALGASN